MANNKIYYVHELNAKADFVNMKVKIIRKVKQSWKGIHMILIDEKGNKIQATVKKELIPNFDEQLKEDAVVLIKKFGCGVFEDSNRVVKGDLKMNFYRCTEVCPEVSFTGHPYGGFNFLPFNEVTKANADNKDKTTKGDVTKGKADNKDKIENVDVIGSVCWCGNLDIFGSSKGKETKRFNFEIKDLEGRVLKCTLWNDYAVQFNNFVKNNTSPEHIITIIQRGIIREWNNSLTIQSDVWATRVFINEEIEEAQDFRRSLILKEGNAAASTSVLSSQVAYPLREEFLENHVRKHVDEIRETEQKMECIVLAEIRMLEEEHGWFYVGCKCTKKVLTKQQYLEKVAPEYVTEEVINAPTDSLWCLTEKKQATQLEPRFRVTFRVQDATGSASFCMLNRDVQNILRLSAADIRERQLKYGDTQAYPHELEKLLNKVFAFHIVVSIYNLERDYNIYTVLKVCDDPDILAELVKRDNDNEVTQEPQTDEVSTVKLAEYSPEGYSSKDAFSVTGDSVAAELEKDTDTSPLQKRSSVTPGAESTSKVSKRVRKMVIPTDV